MRRPNFPFSKLARLVCISGSGGFPISPVPFYPIKLNSILKYKPLKLTKQGLKEATLIIRKHRLSEMFLNQVMGFGWEEVHDMAEEMEHLKSESFFDRMDELLGFPKKDPHGSPIPDKNGNFVKPNYKLLSQVNIGKKVALRALRESSTEFINFLNNVPCREFIS